MSVEVQNLWKSFGTPPTHVLKGINLKILDGELVSITGRSGSGKSTLLYAMSTLDRPTQGNLIIDDHSVFDLTQKQVHQFRNEKMGFVFQFHYLLPELSALENILMPARKMNRQNEIEPYARHLMDEFGLADKADRLSTRLSGGEQQRVAIARSLVMKPKYIFADEPTGNLDTSNGELVMSYFQKVNREQKTTIIFVTHDSDFASLATRSIKLIDGQVSM